MPLDIRFSSDGPSGFKSRLTVALAEWPEGCGFPRVLEYYEVMDPLQTRMACLVVFCCVPARAWIDDDTLVCIPWKI